MPDATGDAGPASVPGCQRPPHREPQDDTYCGRQRNRHQKADETEQPSEPEQHEHQPDRIELDAAPDDARGQHMIGQGFTNQENSTQDHQLHAVRPEPGHGDAHGNDKADARPR